MEFTLHAALPASDIDRAKAWYSEKLGVEPVEGGPGGELRYDIGGTTFGLYKSAFAGTNQATAAMLAVSDFDATRASCAHGASSSRTTTSVMIFEPSTGFSKDQMARRHPGSRTPKGTSWDSQRCEKHMLRGGRRRVGSRMWQR